MHPEFYTLIQLTGLQPNLSEMRIQELEAALTTLQAQITTDIHPLLRKMGSNRNDSRLSDSSRMDEISQTAALFGTLAIGKAENYSYFGSSAGSEALMFVRGAVLAKIALIHSF